MALILKISSRLEISGRNRKPKLSGEHSGPEKLELLFFDLNYCAGSEKEGSIFQLAAGIGSADLNPNFDCIDKSENVLCDWKWTQGL